MKTTAVQQSRPPHTQGDVQTKATGTARSAFLVAALNMSWQLAIVVLVPIIGGAELDKAFKTSPVLVFVGLALALVGTVGVMWRTVQQASRLPVPKLTDAERRQIQKQYEEDDD